MKRVVFCLVIAAACTLMGCKHSAGTSKVSATGSIYECVLVAPAALAPDMQAVMGADMPCLPQMEPYFNVTHVPPTAFDNFLKSARNILIVDINPDKYTALRIKYLIDLWSTPQAVCRIQSPDNASAAAYWDEHGEQVREWFVRQELARQAKFYRGYTDKEARAALKRGFGCDMFIQEDYMLIMDTVTDGDLRFLWCCNDKGPMRRDIVVYSYPYTDAAMFSPERLNAKRDEVLGRFITATVQGSYMGTEYKIFPPQQRDVLPLPRRDSSDTSVGSAFYATEVRGLWKIFNGEAMGGPYVSLTRVDTIHNRIVTAETFLFAAGQKKRNAVRKEEAVLYTLQLP